jgi:hypothetical protein
VQVAISGTPQEAQTPQFATFFGGGANGTRIAHGSVQYVVAQEGNPSIKEGIC